MSDSPIVSKAKRQRTSPESSRFTSKTHVSFIPLVQIMKELQLHIFSFLELEDLISLRQTNKKVCSLVDRNSLKLVIKPMGRVSGDDLVEMLSTCSESDKIYGFRSYPMFFDPSLLPLLPRTLKEMKISHCSYLTIELFNCFPPSLIHLDLTKCTFEHSNTQTFQGLPNTLETLILSACYSVVDSHLQCLPPKLKKLNLYSCKVITDNGTSSSICFIKSGISKLPTSLQILDLGDCISITDLGILKLPASLERLNVAGCSKLRGFGFQHLKKLHYLNIFNCNNIADDAFAHFPPNIRERLTLPRSQNINDAALVKLTSFVSVQKLNIHSIHALSLEGLKKAVSLRELVISGDNLQSNFASNLPLSLRRIEILNVKNFGDDFLKYFPPVNEVALLCCGNITEKVLQNLPISVNKLELREAKIERIEFLSKLPNLKVLRLADCLRMKSWEGMKLLSQLEHLDLKGRLNLNPSDCSFIPENLLKLELFSCIGVNDLFLEHLPNMKHLQLTNLCCTLVTEEAVKSLKRKYPNLKVHYEILCSGLQQ